MKASICFLATLLGLSQAFAGSAYLQIENSSTEALDGHWAYVGPNSGAILFSPKKSQATNFSIEGSNLAAVQPYYIAGSTNAQGSAYGGVIYMGPSDLYVQGGEPEVSAEFDNTGVVLLSDTLGDGLVRDIPLACYFSQIDSSLPVLVLGEEYFDTDGCANITLYWHPAI